MQKIQSKSDLDGMLLNELTELHDWYFLQHEDLGNKLNLGLIPNEKLIPAMEAKKYLALHMQWIGKEIHKKRIKEHNREQRKTEKQSKLEIQQAIKTQIEISANAKLDRIKAAELRKKDENNIFTEVVKKYLPRDVYLQAWAEVKEIVENRNKLELT